MAELVAGLLDVLVDVEAKTTVQDSFGEPIETWTKIADAWMRVKSLKGDERFTARQFLGKETKEFEMRWRTSFTPTVDVHRLSYNGRKWDIFEITEIQRRQGWNILASARSEG